MYGQPPDITSTDTLFPYPTPCRSMGMTGIARAARVKAVGLQLYTVRELFANDPVGTLEKVVRIGYREVEFGGGNYEKMDPAMLRAAMDRLHLDRKSTRLNSRH